jgi:hypothetical protein
MDFQIGVMTTAGVEDMWTVCGTLVGVEVVVWRMRGGPCNGGPSPPVAREKGDRMT